MSSRLSIAAAARAVGRSRQTLYDHIKQGKLKVHHDHERKPFVYTDALIELYGNLLNDGKPDSAGQSRNRVNKTGVATSSDGVNLTLFDAPDVQLLTPADSAFDKQAAEIALLREQLNFEREKRQMLEQQMEIERISAAKIEELLRMQLLLLEDKRPVSLPVLEESPQPQVDKESKGNSISELVHKLKDKTNQKADKKRKSK